MTKFHLNAGLAAISLSALAAVTLPAFADHADHGHSPDAEDTRYGDIADAVPGTYVIEPTHAYISMKYNHLGFSTPILGFTKFDGTLNVDPENLDDISLTVNIDPASIDSRVDVFDGHLKGEKFFNVAEYPEITFVSTAAMPESSGHGKIAGNLTIKGITKPVVLDVILNKAGKNPISQKDTIGISATTTLKRSEWDLGLYAPNVSDEVDIVISTEFIKQ